MTRLGEVPLSVRIGAAMALLGIGSTLLTSCTGGKNPNSDKGTGVASKTSIASTTLPPKPSPSLSPTAKLPACSIEQLGAALPRFRTTVQHYETANFAHLTPAQLAKYAKDAVEAIGQLSINLSDVGYGTFYIANKQGYFKQEIVRDKGVESTYVYDPVGRPSDACVAYSLDIDKPTGNPAESRIDVQAMGNFTLALTDTTISGPNGSGVSVRQAAIVNAITDDAFGRISSTLNSHQPSGTPTATSTA